MRTYILAMVVALLVFVPSIAIAQWEAPFDYYSLASGTGSQLKSQLTTIMSNGHIERRYGDFRFSAAIHDQDLAEGNKIVLVYNNTSVGSAWDSGSTWNREHIWPQSRQPGSASNSTRGNLGDPHALRPANPGVNSSRGNKPFGFGDTIGAFGSLGTFWFPGDQFKGDVARSLFYSDTRWTSLGISLTNGTPTGNQMGDLNSMVQWHYLDTPDEFERRRNHTIFSQDYNPQYYTNNRNAFVDRPEYVWSIYMDQQNDTTISIDGNANANGSSTLWVDFGAVIVGGQTTLDYTVNLNKSGLDGTYFSVQAFDDAISSVQGRYNAFAMNSPGNRNVDVALDVDNTTPGITTGMVVVDNLDVTTLGGMGNGANDGDDIIDLSLAVLDHSNASFSSEVDLDTTSIDLGEITTGQSIDPMEFSIYNLASTFGELLTAELDLFSIDVVPATGSGLEVIGQPFDGLVAGASQSFTVTGTAGEPGNYQAAVVILLSDEDLPGSTTQVLQFNVSFEVTESAVILGDVNQDGLVNLLDVNPFVEILASGLFQAEADVNEDGLVNILDIKPFVGLL